MKRSACGLDVMLDLTCVLWSQQGGKTVQESFILSGCGKAKTINPGRSRRNRTEVQRRIDAVDEASILDADQETLFPEEGRAQYGTRDVGNPEPMKGGEYRAERNWKLATTIRRNDQAVCCDEVAGSIVGAI